jgi:Family of unknown function (DUF5995)
VAVEVADLLLRMERQLAELEQSDDPARFFLGTYLRTTRAIADALDDGTFEDPAWVAELDVAFAQLYLDALAAHRRDPVSPPATWRRAFAADPSLPPEAHVLLGVHAHINVDLPQALVATMPPEDFADSALCAQRRRDHGRIDRVLASRVAAEDVELERSGGRRGPLDRLIGPLNRTAVRRFLREARRTVWANTSVLHRARDDGQACLERRVAELDAAGAARVQELLRPGPVLLRLAIHGFGVALPPDPPPPWD